MGCYAVAAMLEEPPNVACRHLVESSAHRLYERLAGTRPGPPQERLELGKRFFYGVEIGRVGRQVEERAASLLDELAHPRTFVRREVVHHHYLPRLQFGSKDPLHIGLEDGLRGCTLHRQRRPDPREAHARQERDVRSPVARRRTKRSLTSARPGIQGRKREVLVPISSTKTKRSGSVAEATMTRQAALSHSSRSSAPTDASMSVKTPRAAGTARL